MAKYTIKQCLKNEAIPEDVKKWLKDLTESRLPTVNNRIFDTQQVKKNKETGEEEEVNELEIVDVVVEEYNKYIKAVEKRRAKNAQREECFEVLRKLIGSKAVKDSKTQKIKKAANPQIISPEELLPRLQALKEAIEQEKKFIKVDKALEATGMTKEQLIEYLQGK